MTRSQKIFGFSLFVITSLGSTQVSAFPEIPFCPLGGPPGWANRLFNDRDDYYRAPPPYYAQPYWRQYPAYTPVYPDDYQYYGYPVRPYQSY